MRRLLSAYGGDAELKVAELRDPMTICDKAVEHANSFDDFSDMIVTPEACVIDVIRGTVICQTAGQVIALITALRTGFSDEGTHVELVRCKNAFASPGPMHFRSVECNLLVRQGGQSAFAAVEVHVRSILELNGACYADEHNASLLRELAPMSQEEMDRLLERVLLCREEASSSAVMISIFNLVLSKVGETRKLPGNVLELYAIASQLVVERRCGKGEVAERTLAMLRRIALANTLDGRVAFSSIDLARDLGDEEMTLWQALQEESSPSLPMPPGIPLVKSLSNSTVHDHRLERELDKVTRSAASDYMFKHLSFQESLCAQALLLEKDSPAREWAADLPLLLSTMRAIPNVFRIGGAALGTHVATLCRGTLGLDGVVLAPADVEALLLMVRDNTALEVLKLGNTGLDDEGTRAVSLALSRSPSMGLAQLDLQNNQLKADAGAAIGTLLGSTGTLKRLHLGWNELGDDGLIRLAQEWQRSIENRSARQSSLVELHLNDNLIYNKGIEIFFDIILQMHLPHGRLSLNHVALRCNPFIPGQIKDKLPLLGLRLDEEVMVCTKGEGLPSIGQAAMSKRAVNDGNDGMSASPPQHVVPHPIVPTRSSVSPRQQRTRLVAVPMSPRASPRAAAHKEHGHNDGLGSASGRRKGKQHVLGESRLQVLEAARALTLSPRLLGASNLIESFRGSSTTPRAVRMLSRTPRPMVHPFETARAVMQRAPGGMKPPPGSPTSALELPAMMRGDGASSGQNEGGSCRPAAPPILVVQPVTQPRRRSEIPDWIKLDMAELNRVKVLQVPSWE
uniref:Uncharacterized protein n=1 Tax=Haptolina brevifila TaxID=156173 RepID=A0A7S2J189_9EUKA